MPKDTATQNDVTVQMHSGVEKGGFEKATSICHVWQEDAHSFQRANVNYHFMGLLYQRIAGIINTIIYGSHKEV